MCSLSTEEAMQIGRKWLRQMAQPFTREDQLGVSLLTIEQLQTKEMQERIQEKVAQGWWYWLLLRVCWTFEKEIYTIAFLFEAKMRSFLLIVVLCLSLLCDYPLEANAKATFVGITVTHQGTTTVKIRVSYIQKISFFKGNVWLLFSLKKISMSTFLKLSWELYSLLWYQSENWSRSSPCQTMKRTFAFIWTWQIFCIFW